MFRTEVDTGFIRDLHEGMVTALSESGIAYASAVSLAWDAVESVIPRIAERDFFASEEAYRSPVGVLPE